MAKEREKERKVIRERAESKIGRRRKRESMAKRELGRSVTQRTGNSKRVRGDILSKSKKRREEPLVPFGASNRVGNDPIHLRQNIRLRRNKRNRMDSAPDHDQQRGMLHPRGAPELEDPEQQA